MKQATRFAIATIAFLIGKAFFDIGHAAFLGGQSIAVTWAAETAVNTSYTAEQGWTPLAATLTMSTPTAMARGMFRPDQDDTQGVMTLGSNTDETSWCAIAFEFQRQVQTNTITDANDAGKDWYFVIGIPVPDGAVNSSFNTATRRSKYHVIEL